jgi:hypothetical protein
VTLENSAYLGDLLQSIIYLLVAVLTVIMIIKALRVQPPPHEVYATKLELRELEAKFARLFEKQDEALVGLHRRMDTIINGNAAIRTDIGKLETAIQFLTGEKKA